MNVFTPIETTAGMRKEINEAITKHIDNINTEWYRKLKEALDKYDKQLRHTLKQQFKQQELQVEQQLQQYKAEFKSLLSESIKAGFQHFYATTPIRIPPKVS